MYYNKSLLDKAGQQYPDVTWTWDKLLSAAKTYVDDHAAFGPFARVR